MKDELEATLKESPAKDRKFVEALSRGLDVLRAFSQGSVVMGNQDIARITGNGSMMTGEKEVVTTTAIVIAIVTRGTVTVLDSRKRDPR